MKFFVLLSGIYKLKCNTVNLIYFFTFLVIALASAQCNPDDLIRCNTIEQELDAKKWPQNKDELAVQCDKLFSGGKCLRDLVSKCLKPDLQNLANQILDAEKNVLSNLCTSGADQFLKDVQDCFNKGEIISGLEGIHNIYVALVEAAKSFDKSTYVQSFCCTELFSLENIHDLNSKECNSEIADRLKAVATNSVSFRHS